MSNKKDRSKLDLERDKLRQYIFEKLNKVEEEFKPQEEQTAPEVIQENVQPASLEDELKLMRDEINSLRQFIASTSNTAMAEMAQEKMDRYVSTIQKYTGVEVPLDEDIFGSDDVVTKAQLASSNNELFTRLQKSLASLGGGGIGKKEVEEMLDAHEFEADSNYVQRVGDTMLGGLTFFGDAIATKGVKFSDLSNGTLTADYTTTDPTKILWTPSQLGVDLGSNENIRTHYGNNIHIAVAETASNPVGRVSRSIDGIRWFSVDLYDSWNASFDNGQIYGAINHNIDSDNEWVIFGAAGQVARSLDNGASWEPRNILSDSYQDSFASSVYSVAQWNGTYVATTQNAIWYSTDRMSTWAKVSDSYDVFDSYNANGETLVAYGGGKWLASALVATDSADSAPSYAKLATSTDGVAWTLVSDFNDQVDDIADQDDRIHSLTYGASKFVLGHGDGRIFYSNDGVTDWTQVRGTVESDGGAFNSNEAVKAIGYGNGLWMFGGDRAHLAVATDAELLLDSGDSGGVTIINTVMKQPNAAPVNSGFETAVDVSSINYGSGTWVIGMRDILATGLWEDSNTPQNLYWRDEEVGLRKHDLLNALATAQLYSIVDVGRDSGLGKYIDDVVKLGAFGISSSDSLPEGLTNLYLNDSNIKTFVDSDYVSSRVTLDGAILFAGNYDLTADSAPTDPLHGNMIVNSGTGTTVASWTGIAGDSVDPGDQAFWDSNASSWSLAGNTGEGLVRLSGDTMTGFLTLAGDPTTGLHAATKQYVDNNTGTAYTGGNGIDVDGTVIKTDSTVLRANNTISATTGVTRVTVSGSSSSSYFSVKASNTGSTDVFKVQASNSNTLLTVKANNAVTIETPDNTSNSGQVATTKWVRDHVTNNAGSGGGVEIYNSSNPPASRDKGTLLLTSTGALYIYV